MHRAKGDRFVRANELPVRQCSVISVCVLCLFLMVPWVGLQCIHVIVSFTGHTHFYFVMSSCHMAVGALCLFLMVQWAGL